MCSPVGIEIKYHVSLTICINIQAIHGENLKMIKDCQKFVDAADTHKLVSYNVAPPDARSSQRKHKDNDCTPPLARAGSAHCCNGKRWWKGLDVRHGSNTTTNVLK
jgi:hypothetical protein